MYVSGEDPGPKAIRWWQRLRANSSGSSSSGSSNPSESPHDEYRTSWVAEHLWNHELAPVSCGRWPTVHVIGAQKSATTSLFSALTRIGRSGFLTYSSEEHWATRPVLRSGHGRSCCSLLFNQSLGAHPCSSETHFLETCNTSELYRAAHGGRAGTYPGFACERYPELFDRSIGIAAVDATPTMLPDGRAPKLLRWLLPDALLPEVKLMVVLRQPTERLYSIFQHKWALVSGAYESNAWKVMGKDETLTAQTFDQWAQRQLDDWREMDHADRYHSVAAIRMGPQGQGRNASDLVNGYYALQLQRWLEVWPRRQILVMNFHDLISQQSNLRSALTFATSGWARALHEAAHNTPGVDDSVQTAAILQAMLDTDVRGMVLPHTNVKPASRVLPRPSCSMQRALDTHYAPHNWNLYRLLETTRAQSPPEQLWFRPFGPARIVSDCHVSTQENPPKFKSEWIDKPTPQMTKANASCTSSHFWFQFGGNYPACSLQANWRQWQYCSFSCFVYGLDYANNASGANKAGSSDVSRARAASKEQQDESST